MSSSILSLGLRLLGFIMFFSNEDEKAIDTVLHSLRKSSLPRNRLQV